MKRLLECKHRIDSGCWVCDSSQNPSYLCSEHHREVCGLNKYLDDYYGEESDKKI